MHDAFHGPPTMLFYAETLIRDLAEDTENQRNNQMQSYMDRNGDSGVSAYEIGSDSITVQFKDGATYLYTNASAGRENIEVMKRLADSGDGLNAYINRVVKKGYASRIC